MYRKIAAALLAMSIAATAHAAARVAAEAAPLTGAGRTMNPR